MARYVIASLLCVFLCIPVWAQEEPDVMSIHLISQQAKGSEHNVFSRHNYTVLQILQDLLDIVDQANLQEIIQRFGGNSNFPPKFVEGNVAQLRSDLDYLLNVFPQAAGVFSNPLAVGEKSFIDDVGNYFTTDEPELFEPLPYVNTYNLTLYAGRNTAMAPLLTALENVEIVTSVEGNRFRIFVRDDTGPQHVSMSPVPTLTHWGMFLLAGVLTAVAVRTIRKKRA